MTVQVALPLAVACWLPEGSKGQWACLAWIALQVWISYLIAGWVKIRNPEWRSGRILEAFASFDQYGVPEVFGRIAAQPVLRLILVWGTMLWELGFGIVFWVPGTALPMLAIGAGFHLANFWMFGLNRFFWAWIAAYPAVWFWAPRLIG
jgi:hypothetical protein